MKVKYAELIFVIVFFFVSVFNMVGLAKDGLGNSLENLPQGKLKASVTSPDKATVLNLYSAELNGAVKAVRGEIVYKNGEKKNIYWALGETNTVAFWLNRDAVMINSNRVDIDGIPYDSRNKIELPKASYAKSAGN